MVGNRVFRITSSNQSGTYANTSKNIPYSVEFGPLKVSAISKISKIARPDVYPTIAKLTEQGLVEKIIESPLKYRAIPMNKALAYMLETRTRQYEKLRSGIQILLCKTKMKKTNKNNQIEDH